VSQLRQHSNNWRAAVSSQHDEIGAQPEWSEADKVKHNRLDYLYHRVFAQNEDGAELLGLWEEHLKMSAADVNGSDAYNLGKEEGKKTFIRNVILTIRKVENE